MYYMDHMDLLSDFLNYRTTYFFHVHVLYNNMCILNSIEFVHSYEHCLHICIRIWEKVKSVSGKAKGHNSLYTYAFINTFTSEWYLDTAQYKNNK